MGELSKYDDHEEYARISEEFARHWEETKKKSRALVHDAWTSHRAMEGWHTVESRQQWEQMLAVSASDTYRGRLLIDTLGAERHLEPETMAAIITLRRAWIAEYGISTAVELMLVDSALIAFFNQLRTQRLIGNLFLSTEYEFFGRDSPSAKLEREYGSNAIKGYRAEYLADKLIHDLQPLLDRANRMMLRNIRALRELKGANITVNVNAPSQVNLAQQQLNVQENIEEDRTSGR